MLPSGDNVYWYWVLLIKSRQHIVSKILVWDSHYLFDHVSATVTFIYVFFLLKIKNFSYSWITQVLCYVCKKHPRIAFWKNNVKFLWFVCKCGQNIKFIFVQRRLKWTFILFILSKKYLLLHVDWYKCLWAFIGGFKRFSGLQSSLGITNVNRSHNKPLELIETI